MQDFEYLEARSVGEAVAALAEKGKEARVLAGGTDILVQLRTGRRKVERLVGIGEVPEANVLSIDSDGALHLGAALPCYRIYQDAAVSRAFPGLIDSAALIGGIQIQGRASLGGNLCNAAPSADGIPPLIALGAVCEVVGPNGSRQVLVEEFCTSPGQNVLGEGELLVSLRIPAPPARSGAHYLRFIPREEMDIAVAGVGSWVSLDDDGVTIKSARVALASVAPTPLFVKEAGAVLKGRQVSEEAIEDAARAAMEAARPIDDMRGSIRQRRHLVGVLTRRTLNGAIKRAREA